MTDLKRLGSCLFFKDGLYLKNPSEAVLLLLQPFPPLYNRPFGVCPCIRFSV